MLSPSASKPSYREAERGHRGTTLCFVNADSRGTTLPPGCEVASVP